MLMNNKKRQHRTHRTAILSLICAVVFTWLAIQTAAAGVPEGNVNSRGAGNVHVNTSNNTANGYNDTDADFNDGILGDIPDVLPDGGARVRSSNGSDMVSDGEISDKNNTSDSMFDKDNGVVSDEKNDTSGDSGKVDDSVTNPVKTEDEKNNTAAIVIIIIVILAIILLIVLLIPRKRKS